MTNLDTFDVEAEYGIFDDFDFAFLPNKKCWWGGQEEFTVTDKYRKKKTITWGKPVIYLTNPDLDPYRHAQWNDWFADNCIRVVLQVPLY